MPHPTHIVAVTAFIQDQNRDILLVRTERRGWELPGGQVENGEDLLSALAREVHEECGLNVNVGNLLGVYSSMGQTGETNTKVIFLFRCEMTGGSPIPSIETPDVGWYSENEALQLVTNGPHRIRLKDALGWNQPIYRVYEASPYKLLATKKL